MNRRTLLGALAAPALIRPALAQQDWPSRAVTLVVPFATGGPSDLIARIAAQHMQQTLGRPFVVENRPGATGEVGARQVIRTAPDGYTLMHAPISTWAINVALRPNLAYDPTTQLTRITVTVRTPNVLVVNPQSVPVQDFAGLIDWMKRNAATASYPSSGVGSSDHLTAEMFKQATGTEMAHIPYSGGGPAMTSLMAGTTQISFQNLGAVIPHIQSGRLKALMVTASQRTPVLPGVPTGQEAGLRDFVVYSWQALGGPPGMAPALVERVRDAFMGALRVPATAQRLVDAGFDIGGDTPEEFATFQAAEIARWKRVVEAGNIRPE
jgi:tripartite-type tricarboxylate transporter receptor subunit TctC